MTRHITVCADDHGHDPLLSATLIELAQRGRLNALSSLCNGPHWPAAAPALAGLPAAVQCGLHFNLTLGAPLSATLRTQWPTLPALPTLIVQAHLGALPLAAIEAELQAQWQAFVQASGRRPSHLDGHQHVHHLPGVRNAVLALARREQLPLRGTGQVAGPGFAVKRMLIERTGGRALQAAMANSKIRYSRVLLGVYDFAATDYRALMQAWLAAAPDQGGLLMCHPSRGADPADPISAARQREATYLGSDAFIDDLQAAGFSLGPCWQQNSSAG